MQQWVTMSEASRILDVTERTIQRYIKEDRYPSKLEEGRRFILLDLSEEVQTGDDKDKLIAQMKEEIEYLREELTKTREELDQSRQRTDQIIQQMQSDAEADKERSDTIVLQFTQQLNEQTKLLEDMRQDKKKGFFKRLFRKD